MTEDLHQWVRHRLAAWRASVLDDAETARVAEHLAACAECRAAADAYAEPTPGAAGMHVPASLIAAWPRAQQALRGLERTLVRRHLERCAECRQDLHALGFEPRLEFVAAWESEASLEPVSAPRVAPATSPTRVDEPSVVGQHLASDAPSAVGAPAPDHEEAPSRSLGSGVSRPAHPASATEGCREVAIGRLPNTGRS